MAPSAIPHPATPMKTTMKLISPFALALLLAHLAACSSAADATKPNIIYIMSDEIAYFEPGFMGGKELKTPNLDRLAASGVIMKNLLSGGPNCAVARGALLTGKHTGHGSVRENSGDNAIRAEEKTIGEVLKTQGYAVGGFGKWGIGGRDSTGVPEKHGFDVFFGYYDQVHAHTFYPPYLIRNSEEVPLPGNKGGSKGQTYSQYLIHDAALKWIGEQAGQGPFFAYLPYTPPHGPFAIPADDPAVALYKDKPWSKDAKLYAAMVSMMDRQIGEVLDLIKEKGIEKNTLIFFSGDNGSQDRFADQEHPRGLFSGNKDPNGSTEFRGSKGAPYDGAMRIPAAVTWPGQIKPGTVSDLVCYFPDILPTMAAVAGAEVPPEVDGLSILPELIGEKAAGHAQQQHEYLYWEKGKWAAIRQGDWRAVRVGRNEWELYNVVADPAEAKDLAKANPDILLKLQALAKQAHEPQRAGTYSTRERADRDRRSKGGAQDATPTPKKGRK